ncbi:potassium/proton antiporter [Blautia schinkii]|nr:potassium/proton antiporter [Blautia schinkii]
MPVKLLLTAIVIIICILLNKLSSKLGIPMLLGFILLGMFFGSDGIVKIPFDNYAFAEQICSVALIFIMFYGGFGTSWKEAKPVALKAALLSTLGVMMTSGLTGIFCRFVLGIDWLESLLVGAVIGSTDAASVFSILRAKRLNLKYNTASLLEVESGSNDPCSYMLTAVIIAVMNGSAKGASLAYMLFSQIIYGIGLGVVIALACVWAMKKIRFTTEGFDTVFVVAAALLAYSAPAALGGNGYLSVYILGIILGNARLNNKVTLVHFFDGVTGLMQMLVFFLLGLLSFPSRLPQVVFPALAIALFLTFIARPAAVFAILFPFKSKVSQELVVSWAGLRGAASIVFAIMAVMQVSTKNDIFHIVFCIVLFSILLQGSLLPLVSKKLDMLDDEGDVLKTFTDYTDEVPVQFIQSSITSEHPWCGSKLADILMPPDTIAALLKRGTEKIVPNGSTVLLAGDKLILCAKSPAHVEGVFLSERELKGKDEWIGKTLLELPGMDDKLIIMIQRNDRIIIPKGNTVLMKNDVLVMNHSE